MTLCTMRAEHFARIVATVWKLCAFVIKIYNFTYSTTVLTLIIQTFIERPVFQFTWPEHKQVVRRPPAEIAVETAEYSFNSAIWGYHIHRQVWTPRHGQRLVCEREHGNAEDRFAVTVIERDRPPNGSSSSLGIVPSSSQIQVAKSL